MYVVKYMYMYEVLYVHMYVLEKKSRFVEPTERPIRLCSKGKKAKKEKLVEGILHHPITFI